MLQRIIITRGIRSTFSWWFFHVWVRVISSSWFFLYIVHVFGPCWDFSGKTELLRPWHVIGRLVTSPSMRQPVVVYVIGGGLTFNFESIFDKSHIMSQFMNIVTVTDLQRIPLENNKHWKAGVPVWRTWQAQGELMRFMKNIIDPLGLFNPERWGQTNHFAFN